MCSTKHSVKVFLLFLSLIYGSFAFSSEDLPGDPRTMTMSPVRSPAGISGSEITGGDFRGITAGENIVFGNQITQHQQITNVSQTKVGAEYDSQYEQLKKPTSQRSVVEFERLLTMYQRDRNPLSLMGFRATGEENPISLEYYIDIQVEQIRVDLLRHETVSLAGNLNAMFRCKDSYLERKRMDYTECLETYTRCKEFYKSDAFHIRQIDLKINTVNEYISLIPGRMSVCWRSWWGQ